MLFRLYLGYIYNKFVFFSLIVYNKTQYIHTMYIIKHRKMCCFKHYTQ